MCIIAVQEPGTNIKKKYFDQCAIKNKDGFGLCYAVEGDLQVFKTMDSNELWEKYQTVHHLYGDVTPIVLHFRWGTAGVRDVTNCHPFYINDKTAFVHNGVISGVGYDKELSDTQLFNNKILKKLSPDFLKEEVTLNLIKDWVSTDKLVFLSVEDGMPKVSYVNKLSGVYNEGIWYSNTGYKTYDNYYTRGKTTGKYRVCSECKCLLKWEDEKETGKCKGCTAKAINSAFTPKVVCCHCKGQCDKKDSATLSFKGDNRFLCETCLKTMTGVYNNLGTPVQFKVGDTLKYLGENTKMLTKNCEYTVKRVTASGIRLDVDKCTVAVSSKLLENYVRTKMAE